MRQEELRFLLEEHLKERITFYPSLDNKILSGEYLSLDEETNTFTPFFCD